MDWIKSPLRRRCGIGPFAGVGRGGLRV